MKLTDKPVTNFLDELASNAPAPGGGSVAAISGALGAALVSMVCNLTLGKKAYADVQDDIGDLLAQSEALRAELTGLLEADVAAYTGYSQAAKMPRDTDDEKAERAVVMQAALKVATDVPLSIAEAAAEVMDLCHARRRHGQQVGRQRRGRGRSDGRSRAAQRGPQRAHQPGHTQRPGLCRRPPGQAGCPARGQRRHARRDL